MESGTTNHVLVYGQEVVQTFLSNLTKSSLCGGHLQGGHSEPHNTISECGIDEVNYLHANVVSAVFKTRLKSHQQVSKPFPVLE